MGDFYVFFFYTMKMCNFYYQGGGRKAGKEGRKEGGREGRKERRKEGREGGREGERKGGERKPHCFKVYL